MKETKKKELDNAFAKALAVAAENDKTRFEDSARFYKDNIDLDESYEHQSEVISEALQNASNGNQELFDAALEVFGENYEPEEIISEESEEQSEEEPEIETKKTPMKTATRVFIALVIALVIVFLAIGVIAAFNHFASQDDDSDVKTSVSNTTWQMSASDYGQNRWFADGIQEIKDAKTEAEAADAAIVWLEKVKTDPALLAGAAQYFLKEDVDSSTLVKDGWATQEAVKLYSRLGLAIGMAKVDVTEAPADGINSGVSNGQVVQAANAGISGDRKAVRATLDDGTVVYIMGRCGNPVTTTPTPNPEGPTDETPPDWIGPGTPDPEPKDPEADVLNNDDLADWKKNDNGEEMEIDSHDKKDNGATVANGLQKDPEEDAEDAEDAAIDAADDQEDIYDDAVDAAKTSGAGIVETKKSLDEVDDPTVIDPNW